MRRQSSGLVARLASPRCQGYFEVIRLPPVLGSHQSFVSVGASVDIWQKKMGKTVRRFISAIFVTWSLGLD